MKRSKMLVVVAGLAGAGLGGAAIAAASIPSAQTGLISACVNKASGTVKIIDAESGKTCNPNEALLSWNQVGAQGPAGVAGPAGPAGPAGSGGGGATLAIIPSSDFGRSACPLDWAFPADNCDISGQGGSESIATAFGVRIDTADYPLNAKVSIQQGAFNYSTSPVQVCLRLWNLDTHQPVIGSESCTTIGAAASSSQPAGALIVTPEFTLPSGEANYAVQERQPDAHAVVYPGGTYYDNLAGLTSYQIRVGW